MYIYVQYIHAQIHAHATFVHNIRMHTHGNTPACGVANCLPSGLTNQRCPVAEATEIFHPFTSFPPRSTTCLRKSASCDFTRSEILGNRYRVPLRVFQQAHKMRIRIFKFLKTEIETHTSANQHYVHDQHSRMCELCNFLRCRGRVLV